MKLKTLLQENITFNSVYSPDLLKDITDIVDVDSSVDLSYNELKTLHVEFGKIGSGFYINNNHLTSLEDCPTEVGGDFYCHANNLTSLEGCPTEVGGDFCCDENNLTSLEGCPNEVGGYFNCSNNNLTSLEGCPNEVGGDFYCNGNQLTSLEGCPSEVNGNFSCSINQLTSLVGIHKLIKKLDGAFYVYDNPIKEGGIGLLLIDGLKEIYTNHPALDIINRYLSQGKMGILACQEELIEAGYEDFAKL